MTMPAPSLLSGRGSLRMSPPAPNRRTLHTEQLLIEARGITQRVMDSVSDEAVLAAFHRFFSEQNIKEMEDASEVLHCAPSPVWAKGFHSAAPVASPVTTCVGGIAPRAIVSSQSSYGTPPTFTMLPAGERPLTHNFRGSVHGSLLPKLRPAEKA